MHRLPSASILTLAAALAVPAMAAAQTPILTEDAEGAPDAKWAIGQPPSGVEPWQKSDSSATKYRGNVFHGGATSFWTGMQPQNWPAVPTTAPAGASVVEGESVLTLKEPLIVPADGATTLKYWSLFQNEGDDQGASEIAVVGADGKPGKWKVLKAETATATGAGDNDPRACDPSRPDYTMAVPFSEVVAPLAGFAGKKVLIRFNQKYGAENRPVSQPCGWYIDDISVLTTGTPGKLEGAAPAATTPGGTGAGTTAPAAKPTVKFTALKGKSKKATLSLTVAGGDLNGVAVTLLKGKKKVGTGKAATLAVGARKVAFKLAKKFAKGAYTVKLTAKAADGSAVTATGKVKGK
jgi:hypothetical protein